ncbi:MAG: PhzF family phenazine biosynthesis protein [Nonomuraea sp.]|nr:PhzF family phenazine biosynthesis protein [Nonomuraea sp.]NUP67051.1 PhzF family phenazine biosynthesis protein [Nonomuraea sp.]NUP84032.1 PhzF family phenazine biosynthesis protein [Nonomuraea sp.]
MSVPFALVDVFSGVPLAGNPAAVVWEADALPVETMRGIAREFNQVETVFVLAPTVAGADRRLRAFTAVGAEVFGAGHYALGAWWVLAATGALPLKEGTSTLRQEIGGQVLPLALDAGADGRPTAVRATQEPADFRTVPDDLAELAACLGLTPADLVTAPPAQVVSTGVAHLMVPVRDRHAVDAVTPDAPRLRRFLERAGGEGCYVFSLDPLAPGSTAYARFFNPTVGIWEDPATGTAAGPLACLLLAHGVVAAGAPVTIEQGHALGRPSLVSVHTDGPAVRIAGECAVSAEGRLHLRPA